MGDQAPLESLAEVNPRSPSARIGESISFVAMADVSERGYLENVHVRPASPGYTSFVEGDVLLAKITPCMENGKGAHVRELPVPQGQGSTEFHVLRARPGTSDRFLYHLTRTESFRLRAESLMTGSAGQRRVPTEFFSKYVVRVPPLEEQWRIAEILDTIDETIQASEHVIAKLHSSQVGLEQQLIASAEGAKVPLQSIAVVDRGKFSARPRNDPTFYGGSHPFIQTGDVTGARRGRGVDFSQSLNALGLGVSRSFPPGTIAVTIAANIADTAILTREMCFPDSVVGVVVEEPNNTRWVEMCIHAAKPKLEARAPQSAQKNINLQDLRPLRIPLPTPGQQRDLAAVWEAYAERIHDERSALGKLRSTRTGLAADLLSGRVRTVAA